MPPCPSLAELEDVLAGRPGGDLANHVKQCPLCDLRLRELRANLALAQEIRQALGRRRTPRKATPPTRGRSNQEGS